MENVFEKTNLNYEINEYNMLKLISNEILRIEQELISKFNNNEEIYPIKTQELILAQYLLDLHCKEYLNCYIKYDNCQILFLNKENYNKDYKDMCKIDEKKHQQLIKVELISKIENNLKSYIDNKYKLYEALTNKKLNFSISMLNNKIDTNSLFSKEINTNLLEVICILNSNINEIDNQRTIILKDLKSSLTKRNKHLDVYYELLLKILNNTLNSLISILLSNKFENYLNEVYTNEEKDIDILENDIKILEADLNKYNNNSNEYTDLIRKYKNYNSLIEYELSKKIIN